MHYSERLGLWFRARIASDPARRAGDIKQAQVGRRAGVRALPRAQAAPVEPLQELGVDAYVRLFAAHECEACDPPDITLMRQAEYAAAVVRPLYEPEDRVWRERRSPSTAQLAPRAAPPSAGRVTAPDVIQRRASCGPMPALQRNPWP